MIVTVLLYACKTQALEKLIGAEYKLCDKTGFIKGLQKGGPRTAEY